MITLHLRRTERIAQPIRDAARVEVAVRMKDAIATHVRHGIKDKPRSKIERIVHGKDVALTGTGVMNGATQRVARADQHRKLHLRNAGGLVDRVVPVEVEPCLLIRAGLFEIGEQATMNRPRTAHRQSHRHREAKAGRYQLVRPHVIVQCQSQLLEIVAALRLSRRFARLLHGGQEDRQQNADDRDGDQQFDQCEATFASHGV